MSGYQIIIHQSFQELISGKELLEITGITPGLLDRFLELELVQPVVSESGTLWFDIGAVPRIRMIQRLRYDAGINLAGISIILDLQDRIQQLRRELEWYKK